MNLELLLDALSEAQMVALTENALRILHERYGPDEPWGFADPSGWKCSPRYCGHFARCPGGGGL